MDMDVMQRWPGYRRPRREWDSFSPGWDSSWDRSSSCDPSYGERMKGCPRPSKSRTLRKVKPLVRYGLHEAKYTSVEHAMTEVSAIAYLMGKGYDLKTARRIVESWEVDERFY